MPFPSGRLFERGRSVFAARSWGMFFELQHVCNALLLKDGGLGLLWVALRACLLLCSSSPRQPFPAISSLFFVPRSCSALTNLCKREGWDMQCQK